VQGEKWNRMDAATFLCLPIISFPSPPHYPYYHPPHRAPHIKFCFQIYNETNGVWVMIWWASVVIRETSTPCLGLLARSLTGPSSHGNPRSPQVWLQIRPRAKIVFRPQGRNRSKRKNIFLFSLKTYQRDID